MEDKQDFAKRRKELLNRIIVTYLKRLGGLLETGFTGNIQINSNHGFPMNHNVSYTISLTEKEKKEVADILEEGKKLRYGEE